VPRLVVEEAFDDLFSSNLTKQIEDPADGMGKWNKALLSLWSGRCPYRVQVGSHQWWDENFQMRVEKLWVFLERFKLYEN
jgi:hypothetical protein